MRQSEIEVGGFYKAQTLYNRRAVCVKVIEKELTKPGSIRREIRKDHVKVEVRYDGDDHSAGTVLTIPARKIFRPWTADDDDIMMEIADSIREASLLNDRLLDLGLDEDEFQFIGHHTPNGGAVRIEVHAMKRLLDNHVKEDM